MILYRVCYSSATLSFNRIAAMLFASVKAPDIFEPKGETMPGSNYFRTKTGEAEGKGGGRSLPSEEVSPKAAVGVEPI